MVPEGDSPERLLRAPPTRQIHPLIPEPNQQMAYDATMRRKTKTLKSATEFDEFSENVNQIPNKISPITPPSPNYPMTPNICVEGGRIEFVKRPLDCASGFDSFSSPGSPCSRSYDEEKFDGDKEALEARIRQLEHRLEAESSNAQRDRMAVAKLQQQLAKREEGVSRDADVARSEVHARLARAEHEAERANVRLRAAHRELARMEETVRSLLQFKNRAETLKQEKSSLSSALEARSIHFRTTISRLSVEKASLESQLKALQDENAARCRDDVAARLVAALLDQKSLREELSRLSSRARDLEAQNRALGNLLIKQLRPRPTPSPASPISPSQIPLIIQNKSPNLSPKTPPMQEADRLSIIPTFNSLQMNKTAQPFGKCPRKNRLTKSNNDISDTSSSSYEDNKTQEKRLSVGNLIIPSCINSVCAGQSIISIKDKPFGDIMSVCVSHHSYKLSADDKRRHQILTDLWTELKGIEVTPQSLLHALRSVDPALWVPPERPLTLNLRRTTPNMLTQYLQRLSQTLPENLDQHPIEDELVVESPESGNRDEGYSTMSSDVQADPSRQSEPNRELEDLKEASDETDNQILLSINNTIIVEDKTESDILYIPFNLALSFNQRNSYPPPKNVLPFQHLMRSFSDSHLFLRLTTPTSQCGENCYSLSSPLSSSPSTLHMDITPILSKDKRRNLLRRTKGTTDLISSMSSNENQDSQDRNSWVSIIDEQVEGCQYDADYVQHWLQLDDTRSALQQQHRDLQELEYDHAELEDWSLNLSSEDLQEGNWKRCSSNNDVLTPGQISLSTLPSIQENNALELEEDVSECLWNNSSYMIDSKSDTFAPISIDSDNLKRDHWPYMCMDSSDLPSPGGSWSSIENSEDCCLNNDFDYNSQLNDFDLSKRSSAISGYSDEQESSIIGTDFTRDFYRLVKFESTKSLASNSSKVISAGGNEGNSQLLKPSEPYVPIKHDRDQALQNVLNFIVEQQKYCHNREELDSLPSRPTSEIHELPPPYFNNNESNFKELNGTRCSLDINDTINSDNESCDIILSENYSSRYNDMLSGTKDGLMPSNSDYLYNRTFNSDENEIDEQHQLKVHQKNEINKIMEAGSTRQQTGVKESRTCEVPTSINLNGHSLLNGHNLSGSSQDNHAEEDSPEYSEIKTPVFTPAETLVHEIIKISKRDAEVLVAVPEEEESCTDNSIMLTSDSMTTSVSTSDTIATEIHSDKKKNTADKSRIPIPVSSMSKKQSQIPVKVKSKIPKPNLPVPIKNVKEQENGTSPNIIVSQGPSHSRIVSFHESATSKDVIDELNRMIRKGEDSKNECNDPPYLASLDSALWRPSGWVHVERDIDFSDPKARANLLDVMLASSDSSPSPTSSCTGSFSSESSEDKADYSKLHKLHRYRRQKKAAALRERGLAVLRFSCFHRPTIIGRDNFFVRYGQEEQEAVACFDFLEEVLPTGLANEANRSDATHDPNKHYQRSIMYTFDKIHNNFKT